MILETCFQSGLNQEEILPENFSAFPLACIRASMDVYIEKSVPWHWHPSFELDYVAEGELLLQTPVHSHKLKKGTPSLSIPALCTSFSHGIKRKAA